MVKVKEQALIEKLVAHAAVEALTEAVLHRLSWRNEMPQTIWLSCAQASLALEVNSVPLSHTIMPGFPWRSTSIVNSRATHRPRGVGDRRQALSRHVIDDVQDAEPSAADELSWTKPRDQRALAAASTRIGAPVPAARRRARRLRTVRPSSR
jgi:hypothetical protein